ncbi:MAG: LysR substrate-binding domain-containing protein, partial [Candidatus Dormibacteria bacterium]
LVLGSNGAIREALVVGLGITLVSRDAVRDELAQGRLVELRAPGTPVQRAWHVITRADEPLTGTAELFIEYLVDEGRFRRPPEGPHRPLAAIGGIG